MILAKLLLAHIIGDFFLQTEGWVRDKKRKTWKSPFLYLHVLVHFSLILILFWDITLWKIALIVAGSHLIIDLIKLTFQNEKTEAHWFMADQIAHILVIVYVWQFFWGGFEPLHVGEQFWIIVTGLLFITYPASMLIQKLMSHWNDQIVTENSGSLTGAGQYIGILERLFTFAAVLTGYLQIIGFLLAAKSVFRFSDLTRAKDRKLTEYILVGTLLSFLIAIAAGLTVSYFITFE
jgi:hypothetical protein